MRERTLLLLVVVVVVALQSAPKAEAGPVEQMSQVVLHPSDANVMAVRYTYGGDGILRTSDGGKSWQLVCDAMLFDPIQTHSGPLAMSGDGHTVMGVFDGLWQDDGHGCGWTSDPTYKGEWIGDVASHPTDPNVIFAVTSTASPMGQHKLNGVIRRDASGAWSDVGTKVEMLFTRLHVVSNASGLRFYAGAIKGQVTTGDAGATRPNYVVRVSDDEGNNWEEFVVGPTDGTFRLQGVDPKNADRIVATINRTPQDNEAAGASDDSVLVSVDRGAHFTEYMKVTEIGGVAFAPDGRIWIGDLGSTSDLTAKKGLWFAKDLDSAATKLTMADYPVQCLGYQKANDTLYACQHFWFGSVKQDSGEFSSIIKFTEVKDFVTCAGTDSAATCQMQLCGAWCGFGHFAQSPVCGAYTTPMCGPQVARAEGYDASVTATSDAGTAKADAGAGSGAAGKTGNQGTGGGGAMSHATDAGSSKADAGQAKSGGKSGCSCSAADMSRMPRSLGLLAGVVFFGFVVRRRRLR
jgi:MYXO-CTERM domain-containing protein